MQLSSDEYERYKRHFSLRDVGLAGQKKLKNASVLIIGAGGLGCPVALYLAAAGLGRIGIVDHDIVEISNLQRQIIYKNSDIHKSKAFVSAEHLRELNPYVKIEAHNFKFNKHNALDLVSNYDYIVDGSDNFPTRYLINDTCVLSKIPYIYAAIYRFEGQATILAHKDGPCYRCLYPLPPPPELVPNCNEAGVLGALPGLLGTIQANETLKLILGIGEPLLNQLLLVESLNMNFQKLGIKADPACQLCGINPSQKTLLDYEESCVLVKTDHELDFTEWQERFRSKNPPLLLDVREAYEYAEKNMGGLLIPLAELKSRMHELEAHRKNEIMVHCHSGSRSKQAVAILRAQGFNAFDLKGGMLAWLDKSRP